jgi:hypothetical protein
MADIEQHGSSDLKRECIVTDEEVHDGVQASLWWPQGLGAHTQYVYDAVAERTAQHLQERRRPPNIASLALDTVGATSGLAVIPMHLPVKEEVSASFCLCFNDSAILMLCCTDACRVTPHRDVDVVIDRHHSRRCKS